MNGDGGQKGDRVESLMEEIVRFMVIVKASKDSEAGVMPTTEQLAAMGEYNEELSRAGVLLAGEGLHPSSKGARVRFAGNSRAVIDGPFAESKELMAIEWAKRIPFEEDEVEIRQVFEAEDFGPALTPELRAQEDRLREASKTRGGY
jgi:hypothetical protein